MRNYRKIIPRFIGYFSWSIFLCTCALTSFAQEDKWKAQTLKKIDEQNQKLARDPTDALATYTIGDLLQKLQRWEDAASAYQRTLRIKPDFAHAHYKLGWCYSVLNKDEEALNAHRRAIEFGDVVHFKLKLAKAQAHYAVGWDLHKLKRYDEAIQQYVEAAKFEPNFQDAFYEIGRVLLAQGKVQEAVKLSQQLDPYLAGLLRKEADSMESEDQGSSKGAPGEIIHQMTKELRPTVTHEEKSKYTIMARDNDIQGGVFVSLVFFSNGKVGGFRILRGLPYGLTAQALIAAEKLRFTPAMKGGKPVSVRGTLEFGFYLY